MVKRAISKNDSKKKTKKRKKAWGMLGTANKRAKKKKNFCARDKTSLIHITYKYIM